MEDADGGKRPWIARTACRQAAAEDVLGAFGDHVHVRLACADVRAGHEPAAERLHHVAVAMQEGAALVTLRNRRDGEDGLAAAQFEVCNCKLCRHPGREPHRIAEPVGRCLVDLQARAAGGRAELRRVHADEDPAVALAIAVDHRLLAAPALQKFLERSHQSDSITIHQSQVRYWRVLGFDPNQWPKRTTVENRGYARVSAGSGPTLTRVRRESSSDAM